MREISLTTDRKTQLVDITEQVRQALAEANGARPRSSTSRTRPLRSRSTSTSTRRCPTTSRRRSRRIVDDGWSWQHDDVDGPNAPSHVRASLLGPQVLVPLDDGRLALGTYQGIFFCEFDGPRERKVLVTPLH